VVLLLLWWLHHFSGGFTTLQKRFSACLDPLETFLAKLNMGKSNETRWKSRKTLDHREANLCK
jgi:hypothetical protein